MESLPPRPSAEQPKDVSEENKSETAVEEPSRQGEELLPLRLKEAAGESASATKTEPSNTVTEVTEGDENSNNNNSDKEERPKLQRSIPTNNTGNSTTTNSPSVEGEILLVDDNKINLKLLAAVMHKLRQTYQDAHDGQQALEAYTSDPKRWKCILMDVSMPVLDGWQATRRIRQHEKEHHLDPPVMIVGLSGLATADARGQAVSCGMDRYMTKPIGLRALEEVLGGAGLL